MKRKIAAILAADAVGYSRLVAEDEEDALARLASHAAVFRDFIDRFGGRVFDTAGDAILAEFSSAVDAIRCAMDIQESLRVRNQAYSQSRQMHFRIGITIGDVVDRNGSLLGDGVNVAARLESIAPEGGICISRSVYEAVANKLSVEFSDKGQQHLKNIPEPVHAYTITLNPTPTKRKRAPRAASLLARHWAKLAVVMVILAGIVGFISARLKQTDQPAPPRTTAETPTPEQNKPGIKSTDGSSQAANETREWKDCHDGTKPEQIVKSCTALIDNERYTGRDLASIYVELGRAQRDRERVDKAIEAYSKAIQLEPSPKAYNNRGIAYFDKRQWQMAVDDYTEAIRLNPKFGDAFNNRAWTKLKMGRANSALKDAQEAVRLLPDKAYTWDTRAHVHETLGNRKDAIKDYRMALSLDDRSEESRSGLKRLGAKP